MIFKNKKYRIFVNKIPQIFEKEIKLKKINKIVI